MNIENSLTQSNAARLTWNTPSALSKGSGTTPPPLGTNKTTLSASITTQEGDRVTISSMASAQLEAYKNTASQNKNAALSGNFEEGYTMRVQGDLNDDEMKDVQHALDNLAKMMNDAAQGRMDQAAARNSAFANWDELAAVDSDIEHTFTPEEVTDQANSENSSVLDFSNMNIQSISDMTKEEVETTIQDMIAAMKEAGIDSDTIQDVIEEQLAKATENATDDQKSLIEQAFGDLTSYVNNLYNENSLNITA